MGGFGRDDLYDRPQAVVDFRFDERTAAVFPDMIHRSVPGYAALLQLFGVIGAGFVPPVGRVYDLGCALGGASIALHRFLPPDAVIEAVGCQVSRLKRIRFGGIVLPKPLAAGRFRPLTAGEMNILLEPLKRKRRADLPAR